MESEYYKSKESVQEYIQLAKDVSGKGLIEKLKRYIKPHSSILEIGSGPGSDWKILKKDFNVTGSDNSPEFINHLRSSIPEGTFLELDASSLKTGVSFDGIYANKVLHHLSDEELENSIERQFEILNSGGIICHSFWKGSGSEVFKGLFVNYHDEDDLHALFESNFEILSLEPYKEFEEGDSLLFIGKKKGL